MPDENLLTMDWTKVVTHPLGLAAFALLLVFWRSVKSQCGWLKGLFAVIAVGVVVAGVLLGFSQQNTPNKVEADKPHRPLIEQKTTGDNSPAVAGVDGDVNITIDLNQSQKDGKQK